MPNLGTKKQRGEESLKIRKGGLRVEGKEETEKNNDRRLVSRRRPPQMDKITVNGKEWHGKDCAKIEGGKLFLYNGVITLWGWEGFGQTPRRSSQGKEIPSCAPKTSRGAYAIVKIGPGRKALISLEGSNNDYSGPCRKSKSWSNVAR